MSKENVALFIKRVNKDRELNLKIARTDKTSEWVAIAKHAGFEFTAQEFAEVVSESLKRPCTTETAVREYMAAENEAAEGELSLKALEAVVGGAAYVICNPLFVRATIPKKRVEEM